MSCGKKNKVLLFSLIFLCGGVFFAGQASAANLYLSPSTGSYLVGAIIPVSINISSSDQSMNAASGIVFFPTDKLEVISLSKSGSIFSLWVQEPSFSNSAGVINFEGIALNPGFTGASGKLITVNFRAKNSGTANLSFSSGSVLANDGQGTNILNNLETAQFNINSTKKEVETSGDNNTLLQQPKAQASKETASGIPPAPQISSPTHPDENHWYNNANPKFVWEVASDITATKLLYNKSPNSEPTVLYSSPIYEKQLDNLSDGIRYFHVQVKNKFGWSKTSHFRFQIDTKSPEPFSIQFIDGSQTDNPRPTVLFNTTDALSGVDFYKVKIGDGDFFGVSSELLKSNPYTLSLQLSGIRTILVQAFDKAGNYTTSTAEFEIKPIRAPLLTNYPQELYDDDVFLVKGYTYPNIDVYVYLESDVNGAQSQKTLSDNKGDFSIVWTGKIKKGNYRLWAEVEAKNGARSQKSQVINVLVNSRELIRIGSLAVNYLAIFIPLLSLIFIFIYILVLFKRKVSKIKGRVRKETKETEIEIMQEFDNMRKNINNYLKVLEKTQLHRELTVTEKHIAEHMKEDLDHAEQVILRHLKNIEK